jgi:hypothetical protein
MLGCIAYTLMPFDVHNRASIPRCAFRWGEIREILMDTRTAPKNTSHYVSILKFASVL